MTKFHIGAVAVKLEDRLDDYEKEDGDAMLLDASDKRFLDTESRFAHTENGCIAWYVRVRGQNYKRSKKVEGSDERVETVEYSVHTDASVQIGDCYRKITWSLDCRKPKDIPARIDKINQAIESLTKLREALFEAKVKGDLYLAENPNVNP